jgi:GxxExxY protein
MNADFKHAELTSRIIGVFFEVYNELGFGFLESVYREAMMIALRSKGLSVEKDFLLTARFSRSGNPDALICGCFRPGALCVAWRNIWR